MKHLWLAPCLLFVPACLENEEELEISDDGSVDVTLCSKGDLADLTDGYPIPLGPPWRLASEDARRWVHSIGGDTGSSRTRERLSEVSWPSTTAEKGGEAEATLAVQAHFDSVGDLPSFFVPPEEPYRTAYLARETSLSIDQLPEGRVFVFQRIYRGFERGRLDPLGQTALPEEIRRKLDAREALTREELSQVASLLAAEHDRAAEALARDAMLGLFTEGDLDPAELAGVLEEMRSASRSLITESRLDRLLELAHEDGDAAGKALLEMEQEWRELLRATLGRSLSEREVAETAKNAVRYALEWQFTAFDHASDVGDETFVLKVKMPGTIVSGNFASTEGGVALFRFEGEALQERDVIFRVVSVL